jgi:hypothetical protein
MIALMAAIALVQGTSSPTPKPEIFELTPSDDVWVYPHASDPEKDAFLRFWGAGGTSVDQPGRPPDVHSYSYLRFDLAALPKRFKVSEATLTLFHMPKPAFGVADSKAFPVELRTLSSDFGERGWRFDDAAKVYPISGPSGLLGTGSAESVSEEKEFKIVLSLATGESKFPVALAQAMEKPGPYLAVALCTRLSPEDAEGAMYKVYSKDGPKEFRPTLKIALERLPLIR